MMWMLCYHGPHSEHTSAWRAGSPIAEPCHFGRTWYSGGLDVVGKDLAGERLYHLGGTHLTTLCCTSGWHSSAHTYLSITRLQELTHHVGEHWK